MKSRSVMLKLNTHNIQQIIQYPDEATGTVISPLGAYYPIYFSIPKEAQNVIQNYFITTLRVISRKFKFYWMSYPKKLSKRMYA